MVSGARGRRPGGPKGSTATFDGSFDHLEGSAGEFLGPMEPKGILRGPKEVVGGALGFLKRGFILFSFFLHKDLYLKINLI